MKISKLAMSALALGFCLPLAAHAACNNAPSASERTGVTTFRQIGDNWFWAAAGQMNMKAIKPFANVKQCIQANELNNQSNG